MPTTRSRSAKLYWCRLHGDEWFVVAETAQRARRFFASSLGAREDDVSSVLVFILDAEVDASEGWPTAHVLETCGVRFTVMRFGTRLAEYDGRLVRAPDIAPPLDAAAAMRMIH